MSRILWGKWMPHEKDQDVAEESWGAGDWDFQIEDVE